MGTYQQIDHTADIALQISANSLEDLYITAAAGWRAVVLEETNFLDTEFKNIELPADSKEELLVNFISELNYLLYVKKWICSNVAKLEIVMTKYNLKLFAELTGEPFRSDVHEIRTEIKAVTYHHLQIKKIDEKYETKLIFDT
jgi:SHS2 domain-containing protein